jgi:hypothetical protein
MKPTHSLFTITGCAALLCTASYAGPSNGNATAPIQLSLRNAPADHNASGVETPGHPHSVPSGQTKPSLKTVRNPGSGAAIIGGPANPTKAAPAITGIVNPAKNTAVVNGTGMNRKP